MPVVLLDHSSVSVAQLAGDKNQVHPRSDPSRSRCVPQFMEGQPSEGRRLARGLHVGALIAGEPCLAPIACRSLHLAVTLEQRLAGLAPRSDGLKESRTLHREKDVAGLSVLRQVPRNEEGVGLSIEGGSVNPGKFPVSRSCMKGGLHQALKVARACSYQPHLVLDRQEAHPCRFGVLV